MADWYVSSVAYTAVAQWASGHTYAAGAIVRQLAAPAQGSERCFRTAAGLTSGVSEPAWVLTQAANTTDNGGTWTEVTGNATYAWSAAGKCLANPFMKGSSSWAGNGDRIFCSSDHTETWTTSPTIQLTAGQSATVISVNRGGSTPPVAGDITTGAQLICNGAALSSLTFIGGAVNYLYFEGFTIICNGGTNQNVIVFAGAANSDCYFKNCTFQITGTSTNNKFQITNSAAAARVTWDNCTMQFGNASQTITGVNAAVGTFLWKNTASALQGATMPTTLFSSPQGNFILRGVDLSATSGNIWDASNSSGVQSLLASDCKVNASATLASGSFNSLASTVDYINVDSGATGYKNFWYRYSGTVSTETTLIRSGGASDGVQAVSHKYVSNTLPLKRGGFQLTGPDYYVWNATTGSSKTATLEILGGVIGALNNDDIWMEVEYLGNSGAPLSSFGNDTVATVLTSNAAQTSSSHTFADWGADCWNPAATLSATLSSSNRTATKSAASAGGAPAVCYFSSGLIYWEVTIGSVPAANYLLGLCNASYAFSGALGATTNSLGYSPSAGTVKINASTLSTIQTAANGDVVGFAVDLTHNKIWIRKNTGNWNNDVIGNQNPASNTGGISTATLAAGPYAPAFEDSANSSVATLNGGSSAFTGTIPSGFSAVNTGATQKLTVSFTPQLAGLVRAQVKIGKTSTTLWVDPLLSVA